MKFYNPFKWQIIKKIKDWIYHPPEIVQDGFGEYRVRKGWFFCYKYFSTGRYLRDCWKDNKSQTIRYNTVTEAVEALQKAEKHDLFEAVLAKKRRMKDKVIK